MEFIPESVLDVLNDFEKKSSEIPQILETYLLKIAENGDIIFPWAKLKPLLKRKLEIVLDKFYETCPVEAVTTTVPNFEAFNFDDLKKTILQAIDSFTSAPFTIQRICELITNPKNNYNRIDKYMRGIEKNVLVISTIEARVNTPDDDGESAGAMVNGMISNSPSSDGDGDVDCYNGHKTSDSLTPDSANIPANRVLLENFANVFPSAACIPSASNICVNREIDSTFMENTECVATLEVISEPSTFETPDNSEAKCDQFSEVSAMEQDFASETNECAMEEEIDDSRIASYASQGEAVRPLSDDSQSSDTSCSVSSDDMNASESDKNEESCEPDTSNVSTDLDKFGKNSDFNQNECQQAQAIDSESQQGNMDIESEHEESKLESGANSKFQPENDECPQENKNNIECQQVDVTDKKEDNQQRDTVDSECQLAFDKESEHDQDASNQVVKVDIGEDVKVNKEDCDDRCEGDNLATLDIIKVEPVMNNKSSDGINVHEKSDLDQNKDYEGGDINPQDNTVSQSDSILNDVDQETGCEIDSSVEISKEKVTVEASSEEHVSTSKNS